MKPDLETDIMNYLQERKSGLTSAQINQHFNVAEGAILASLHSLVKKGLLAQFKGKWFLKRKH